MSTAVFLGALLGVIVWLALPVPTDDPVAYRLSVVIVALSILALLMFFVGVSLLKRTKHHGDF